MTTFLLYAVVSLIWAVATYFAIKAERKFSALVCAVICIAFFVMAITIYFRGV